MAIAGTNCRSTVWRIAWDDDDAVGGAMITGSVQYYNRPAFLQANPEEQIILQQGLETVRIYTVTLPGTLDIRERDELQVIAPFDHQYINNRFRVVGVRHSIHPPRDPRHSMILQATRSVRAHTRQ
jgi:hypothetical protein